MKRSKGFTLIELLAVIVILAIIALIATPMVLKYIDNAKEGSNDISAESILRAADNYYAGSLLNNNEQYPISFDLTNKDDLTKLGLKGQKPNYGKLIIYSDGTTFLEVGYGDTIYTKNTNEIRVNKNDMIIGDIALWETNGTGVITKYKNNEVQLETQASNLFYMYDKYMAYANRYALGMEDSRFPLDFSKSLVENINDLEESGTLDNSNLPLAVNKEIETIIKFADVEEKYTLEELQTTLVEIQEQIPLTMDYITITNMGNNFSNKNDTNVYKLILENLKISNLLIVPNYVKHEDGTLEKITAIGQYAFLNGYYNNAATCLIRPINITDKGKDIIISYGIISIGTGSFQNCLINSVTFSNTVETIGGRAFETNKISTLVLPSKLKTIGERAFASNNLGGKLVIPKNVMYIANSAFTGEDFNCYNPDELGMVCNAMVGVKNHLTEVVFEEGSKIEWVYDHAFHYNQLTTITIPGSIEWIDEYAFSCPTLTTATIQRAKVDDDKNKIDEYAFENASGIVTPIYQP